MILRRLIDALRKQDWVTVVIETLIVLPSVLLGPQVQRFAVDRERQRSARRLRSLKIAEDTT